MISRTDRRFTLAATVIVALYITLITVAVS
jgi:hypothetical protein